MKLPGLGLTLCSLGFAMITAFAVLLFAQKGWAGGALAVTSMGAGFIAARLLFGHLPDQVGGARVARACVVVVGAGIGIYMLTPVQGPARGQAQPCSTPGTTCARHTPDRCRSRCSCTGRCPLPPSAPSGYLRHTAPCAFR